MLKRREFSSLLELYLRFSMSFVPNVMSVSSPLLGLVPSSDTSKAFSNCIQWKFARFHSVQSFHSIVEIDGFGRWLSSLMYIFLTVHRTQKTVVSFFVANFKGFKFTLKYFSPTINRKWNINELIFSIKFSRQIGHFFFNFFNSFKYTFEYHFL